MFLLPSPIQLLSEILEVCRGSANYLGPYEIQYHLGNNFCRININLTAQENLNSIQNMPATDQARPGGSREPNTVLVLLCFVWGGGGIGVGEELHVYVHACQVWVVLQPSSSLDRVSHWDLGYTN